MKKRRNMFRLVIYVNAWSGEERKGEILMDA